MKNLAGGSGSGSLLIICRNIHEQLVKVSRRIVVVEQQHKQISLAVKELSSLMKRQRVRACADSRVVAIL